jgi:glycosyltransferase involved in cell wall biosynthesis
MTSQASQHRVGFVSTRFAGTDGVSLETAKWAMVLERLGLETFYLSGLSDRPEDRSRVVPELFFRHPAIDEINRAVYASHVAEPEFARIHGATTFIRPSVVSDRIHDLQRQLKAAIYDFSREFGIDLLIVENASAIPLNLPLGLAISEFIAETGMPTIAHHHDLHWERQRFLVNGATDILSAAFPPAHPPIRHVVINSIQALELASRRGVTARVIPNVMDFDVPPVQVPDDVIASARADLGLLDGELMLLQPTRVIARKGIEHAIEFSRRLGRPSRLVISHASGDEGTTYEARIREYADLLGVTLVFAENLVAHDGVRSSDGARQYTLDELYQAADFVTYPSEVEGFGNAFLEAVFHRRPILVNNYSTYEVDLRPRGFRVVWFDEFISQATIDQACRLLDDRNEAATWAERNYGVGRTHFSYTVLERHLTDLLVDCFGAAG